MASENRPEIGIAVVGTGVMGADHLRRIPESIAGARVVAVVDADPIRAEEAAKLAPGAKVAGSLTEALDRGDVDGVLIATPGSTHYPIVMEALNAGVPILCEKPLTEDAISAKKIVDAETELGKRLIQVGFMRRFDRQYKEVKSAICGGELGDALVGRFVHRLEVAPPRFAEEDLIPESSVHEFDTARWLFDEEVASVEVLKPRNNRFAAAGLPGPQLLVIRMVSQGIIVVEANLDCSYGYEVSGEITLEKGTLEFGRPDGVTYRQKRSVSHCVPPDFRGRFLDAYNDEIQAWVDGIHANRITGPSAWDGYAATVVVETGVRAQRSGKIEPVNLPEKPDFYTQTD
ncbi:Gfo/Idh/MocA family protein [Kocuria massiliensis]|uniref:Gfo/Idh/MocA family protein n=1 Tax=Kocuria massiliensis TaxID=1926282 RepID=UPI000A1C84DF|nr:Gfo/Idh/MocA family oxidoreductase [Kocuria massiliensis]